MLKNLTDLELQNFVVPTLRKSFAIQSLLQLRSLKLVNMQLRFILKDSLEEFRSLKHLEVSGNRDMRFFPVGAIYSVPSLEELVLKDNGLVKVPGWAFFGLPNLKSLDLSRNQIDTLRPDAFRNVSNTLEKIDLTGNLLTTSSISEFSSALDLPAIETLRLVNLNKNNAPVVIENAFRGPKQFLTSVALMENRFNAMDLWNEVARLKSVQELDLSDNGLTNLPRSAFANNTKVKTLTISNNNIGPYLSASQLDGLQASLQQLGLNSNGIQTIDSCLFTEFPKLHMVTLYGNPLSCDCRLRGLKTWMESLDFLYAYLTQAKCASPESVGG
uniref:Slit homolog 3 protein-like n=1 Tax=Crassostrea virginica TaxID=6565 RepID=A0A8B8EWP5_CRAVI|nr:slit homolog 3 protein-like [Crassostrea virginica]